MAGKSRAPRAFPSVPQGSCSARGLRCLASEGDQKCLPLAIGGAARFMQRDCHHARFIVERTLYTIAMVHVKVKIEHLGMVIWLRHVYPLLAASPQSGTGFLPRVSA